MRIPGKSLFVIDFPAGLRAGGTCVPARPVPPSRPRRKRWLTAGHWWLQSPGCIDPFRL